MSKDEYIVTPDCFEHWLKPILKVQYPRAQDLYKRIHNDYGLRWCFHLTNVLLQAAEISPVVVREALETLENEIEMPDIFPEESFRWLEHIGFDDEEY
jgi:hypothetical protein